MASYGLRHDITVKDGLFSNENKLINWRYLDEDGAEIDDMTGREFNLYVLQNPRQPLDEAMLSMLWGVDVTAPEPPYIRATFGTSTTIPPGTHFYRLRRADSGNVRTIAYGLFTVASGEEEFAELVS